MQRMHNTYNQQQQVMGLKSQTGNLHGKSPMLMASNDVFTIAPYRSKRDATRISVVEKYEIIGYIAAGTYGKVYKAKSKIRPTSDNSNRNFDIASMINDVINMDPTGLCTTEITSGESTFKAIGSENDPTKIIDESINGINPLKSPTKNEFESHNYSRSMTTSSASRTLKKQTQSTYYAIKKFKTERDGVEQVHYTGISQSACREMALCRELSNKHLTKLVEIFLEKKSIYLVYEYAEHDLLQIIHFHSHPERKMIPQRMVRSIMWQILDGVSYLHQNWILHRDLKPANIMVTVDGCVKIGDLGLARKFHNIVQTLYTGDKVVVTIWYRAPELLLGARHYTPAVDLWAVGCIFAELINLQPIFKGEEAKMDSKKTVPFQANQMQRILEVLGTPTQKLWPTLYKYPDFDQLSKFPKYRDTLPVWYHSTGGKDRNALDLLYKLLAYDPITRIGALAALDHDYFTNSHQLVCNNVFEGLSYKYPARRIHTHDNNILNIGNSKNKSISQQTQNTNNNTTSGTLGGLGVNRRILAAAAAAAAAVSGNSSGSQSDSRKYEPQKKRRR